MPVKASAIRSSSEESSSLHQDDNVGHRPTSRSIGGRDLLVVLVIIAFRGIAAVALPNGLNADTDGYREIAVTLRTTGTYGVRGDFGGGEQRLEGAVRPTAYRPPLYPVLLAPLVFNATVAPMAVAVLHLVLGLAAVGLVLRLGIAWQLGGWAWLAAVLTAFDPILMNQSLHIMTETLAAFLAVLALVCLTNAQGSLHPPAPAHRSTKYVLAGMAIGVAGLARPTFLPWGALIALSFLVYRPVLPLRWERSFAFTCGMALTLLPWGLRNQLQFDRFITSTTHGGYTMLLGNNPWFYAHLREAGWDTAWRPDDLARVWAARNERPAAGQLVSSDTVALARGDGQVERGELEDDELAYSLAKQYIEAEPGMFVAASLWRIGRLWDVWPRSYDEGESLRRRVMRLATAGWYLMVYGLVAIAVVKYRALLLRPPWLWGMLLCLTFTLVHSVYWTDMRMRGPLMPFIYLLAAAGAAGVPLGALRRNEQR
jgi:4-amino-4-deoxy-L-arabinose transferase-like glycosyltransferase